MECYEMFTLYSNTYLYTYTTNYTHKANANGFVDSKICSYFLFSIYVLHTIHEINWFWPMLFFANAILNFSDSHRLKCTHYSRNDSHIHAVTL